MKSVWPLALFVLSSCAATHSIPVVSSGEYDQCVQDAYYVTQGEYERLVGPVADVCRHLHEVYPVYYPVQSTPCGSSDQYAGCFSGDSEEVWITQSAVLHFAFRVTVIHEWLHAIEHCAGSTRPAHTDNLVWGLVRAAAESKYIDSCPD